MMLADLTHAGLVRQRMVEALSPQESEQLLMSRLGASHQERGEVQRAVRRTGGVPFYLVSYAQELVTTGMALGGDVPWNVAHSLRQRVAALPPLSQGILEVAAVAGRVVPWALLTRVIGRPDGEVLAGLEAGCSSGLLEQAGGDAYQFRHDVIREVIETDLGAARRKLLHRRIAEALECLPERDKRAAELTWHFLESQDLERALPYALLAGDQAEATFAYGEAEEHYRMALELAGKIEDRERESEAREKMGGVLQASGQYEAALPVFEEAATIYEAANKLEDMGRIVAKIGRAHALKATPEEGVARLRPVLALLAEGGPSPALGQLYAELTRLLFVSGKYREQLVAADRAAELAEALGDQQLLAQAKVSRGDALVCIGDLVQGRRQLIEAMPSLEAAGTLDTLAFALSVAGFASLTMGEFEEGRAYAEHALELARRVGVRSEVELATLMLGRVMFRLGNWMGARSHFEQAAAAGNILGCSWGSVTALLHLGTLEVAEGNWDRASSLLEQCVETAESRRHLEVLPVAQEALARFDLLQGRPHSAVLRLEPLAWCEGTKFTSILPTLAQAYLDQGDGARAQATVSRAIARAKSQHNQLALVQALHVWGMVCMGQRSWEEAMSALGEALALAHAMLYPYAEAQALYELGRAFAETGQSEQARERLQKALSIFRRMGAMKDIERTEHALDSYSRDTGHRRLDGEVVPAGLEVAGRRPARLRPTWPASLTDREVEVLRLIATGASYREAARELGISPKTVRHHIEHVYDKAGVSTRAAAAVFAMEHGLVPH
jgi:tetratricopeptide (TPR) repeat protein/DNA-binding CsgD family transcriptional regulator